MKRLSLTCLLLSLFCANLFCAVTSKSFRDANGNSFSVFYVDGKEIARRNYSRIGSQTTGTIPDGPVKEFYPDGRLQAEATYGNNRLNGPMKAFGPDGSLIQESFMKDDCLHGTVKTYGAVKTEQTYKNGVPDGPMKMYHPNGKLWIALTNKNGKEEGEKTEYNADGTVKSRTFYKNGVIQTGR